LRASSEINGLPRIVEKGIPDGVTQPVKPEDAVYLLLDAIMRE